MRDFETIINETTLFRWRYSLILSPFVYVKLKMYIIDIYYKI